MASLTDRLKMRIPSDPDPADVPSDLAQSLGILDNAVINAGQGGFSAAPAAGRQGFLYYANDVKALLRDNGASWDVVGMAPPFIGTSLPDPLFSGMEAILQAQIATTTDPYIYWHLRYVASSPAGQRWSAIGSTTPLMVSWSSAPAVTATASAALTGAPTLTVPVSGLYDIEIFSFLSLAPAASTLGEVWYQVKDSSGAVVTQIGAKAQGAGITVYTPGTRTQRKVIPAGPLTMWAYQTGTSTAGLQSPSIKLTPVAVGG